MNTVQSKLVSSFLNPADTVSTKKASRKKASRKTIEAPLTVGEKLRRAREKMGLSLVEVEQKTLIRAKYLAALETSKFYELPLPVYTHGFVQTYATFLGLSPKKVLTQFQGEYGLAQKVSVGVLGLESSLKPTRLIVTPKAIWTVASMAAVCALVAYLGVQVYNFYGLPNLQLDSPGDAVELSAVDTITVTGQTDPGAVVKIGDSKVLVDEQGHFAQDMSVEQGTNRLTVQAVSRAGKTRVLTRTFKVDPPTTTLIEPKKDNL